MRVLFILLLVCCQYLPSQECLIDSKPLYSIGESEVIENQKLILFTCDDGHQMWLSQENDITKNPESVLEKLIINRNTEEKIIKSEKMKNSFSNTEKIIPVSNQVTQKNAKIGLKNYNQANSLNIQKYGIETLLHRKIESDRIFNSKLNKEKNDLVRIMNRESRIFEHYEKNNSKLRISPVYYFSTAILVIIGFFL